jgi:hypothetical protein
MRSVKLWVVAVGAALTLGSGVALADTMHPALGAKLAGMGEHGIVNLQSHASKGQLCWTFDLSTKGITGASVRDAHGMIVARLGSAYNPKSCTAVSMKGLDLIESKPGSYWVWVDTKGHPGELRGKLFAGMAHM